MITNLVKGPPLPKPLSGHATVQLDGDLVVIGGVTLNAKLSPDLLRLSCSNGLCTWIKLPQQLKTPRMEMVATVITYDMLGCT